MPSNPPPRSDWPESAVRTPIATTALARPGLRADAASLRRHFAVAADGPVEPLENPHVEPRVTALERRRAAPSSVLIAVVDRSSGPTVLVTTRHEAISFPGHIVFPGGRSDPADATPIETALREAEEEIGLARERVEVLGRLGDYVTHSGFRIAPVVALVEPPIELRAQASEVAAIHELPLARLLDSSSYALLRRSDRADRAYFAFEHGGLQLTGATVSLCIGLYAELCKTHG